MDEEQQQDDQNLNTDSNVEKLQSDLLEALNGWKRTAADFDNYRRRSEAEKKELLEFAKEVTVVKLLPTIDTLEQALRHLPEYTTPFANAATPPLQEGNGPSSPPSEGGVPSSAGGGGIDFAKQYQNWQVGINGLVMQLDKVLEELGVKKIEAVGKKFDPHLHEAVKEIESEADEGIVVDELQSGFELNGKIIRPSQVVISKKADKSREAGSTSGG